MSEMIERVARAMCAHGGFDADDRMANDGARWTYYVPLVVASIKAMREPTEAMIEKGSDARKPGNSRWGNSHGSWKAMIDEAMK